MKKQLTLLLFQKNPHDSVNIARALEEAFPFARVEKINNDQKFENHLHAGDFHLVVSDYKLGWGNGLQVLRRVKSLDPKIPVILYIETAYENKAVEGMDSGLDDYVFKRQHSYLHLVTTVRRFLDDIQQRRELREAQVRFQNIFENVPIGLYRTSPAGDILAANSALVEILGFPDMESLLGSNSAMIYINPTDRNRWRELVEKEGVIHEFEIPIQRWDGARIWVRDSGRVVRNADGEVMYYEGSLEDITDRVRADEKLRFQAQLLDNVREAVVATDLDGRIIYWSKWAEKLFGYAAEEKIGKLIAANLDPQDQDAEIQRMQEVKEKGSWRGQYQQKRKDGTYLWTDTFISLIKDSDGIPLGMIGIDRDITELQRLHKAERDQREMAEALREAGAALSSTLDFNTLLDLLLQQVARLVPYECGLFLLLEGGLARVVRLNGFGKMSNQNENRVAEITMAVESYPNLVMMVESGQPLVIQDTRNYPGWVLMEGFDSVRSWIGAPLIAQGRLMGSFH